MRERGGGSRRTAGMKKVASTRRSLADYDGRWRASNSSRGRTNGRARDRAIPFPLSITHTHSLSISQSHTTHALALALTRAVHRGSSKSVEGNCIPR
jgi:hypothetical protein